MRKSMNRSVYDTKMDNEGSHIKQRRKNIQTLEEQEMQMLSRLKDTQKVKDQAMSELAVMHRRAQKPAKQRMHDTSYGDDSVHDLSIATQ